MGGSLFGKAQILGSIDLVGSEFAQFVGLPVFELVFRLCRALLWRVDQLVGLDLGFVPHVLRLYGIDGRIGGFHHHQMASR